MLRIIGFLLASACSVVGCGGRATRDEGSAGAGAETTSGGAGVASGGTSGIGSGSTTSGGVAPGGASGSGGAIHPAGCPLAPPAANGVCDSDEVCRYVTAVKPCCEEQLVAECRSGRWNLSELDCDCPEVCAPGLVLCGRECTDVSTDPQNCGACGASCSGTVCLECGVCFDDAGSVCSLGVCSSSCAAGLAQCGSSCVNLCSDPFNCGGCGAACPNGTACANGACVAPDGFACSRHEDCTVTHASCCGACGAYTEDDVIAIRRDQVGAYRDGACAAQGACPPCAPAELPSIVPVCEGGRCQVLDLTQHEVTACSGDDGCVVTTHACCECGAPPEYVAIGSGDAWGLYASLVCEADQGCDACLHDYPSTIEPICVAGHCRLTL